MKFWTRNSAIVMPENSKVIIMRYPLICHIKFNGKKGEKFIHKFISLLNAVSDVDVSGWIYI